MKSERRFNNGFAPETRGSPPKSTARLAGSEAVVEVNDGSRAARQGNWTRSSAVETGGAHHVRLHGRTSTTSFEEWAAAEHDGRHGPSPETADGARDEGRRERGLARL